MSGDGQSTKPTAIQKHIELHGRLTPQNRDAYAAALVILGYPATHTGPIFV